MKKVEKILKDIYLNALKREFRAHPIIDWMRKTTIEVYGKEIRNVIETEDGLILGQTELSTMTYKINVPDRLARKETSDRDKIIHLDAEIARIIEEYKYKMSEYLFKQNGTKKFKSEEIFDKDTFTGISELLEADKVYNLERKEYKSLQPLIVDQELTIEALDDFIAALKNNRSTINSIIMSPTTELKIRRLGADIEKGSFSDEFRGIKLFIDTEVRDDVIYFLDLKSFEIKELRDWSWLEDDDRNILRDTYQGSYTGLLVKHFNIICKELDKQGVFNIKEQ